MPRLLRIKNRAADSSPPVDLQHFAALIAPDGSEMSWRAFPMAEPMEIIGDLSAVGTTAVEFGKRVDTSPAGVALTWDEFVTLAGALEQTYWAMFLGCRDAEAFEELAALFLDDWHYLDRAAPAFYQRVEIGVQAVDGWFWLVYARDEALMDRIRRAFPEAEEIANE